MGHGGGSAASPYPGGAARIGACAARPGPAPHYSSAVVARDLGEVVEAGWAAALAPVAGQITAMGDFLRAELAAGRRYLPAGQNVLRAFTQPFADVKVLIVGQDPYPTPGHAVGLSFSVPASVRPLPPSLVNIFREYSADLGYPPPASGDLVPWAERGVLLLNRVLTVQPGKPGSHRGRGWEEVTGQAIRALAARPGPLVRFCGAATLAAWRRCSARCPGSSPPTPARTPPTAGSSAPVRSPGPTTCSCGMAASPSTGSCPDRAPWPPEAGRSGPRWRS
jgi:uracil-DNA glycosylase